MTAEKIREVVAVYRRMFDEQDIPELKCRHSGPPNAFVILSHCHAMLTEIDQFAREGRTEKAFRWLGFVQGCLWSAGAYSIEELKAHNKPPAV